MATSLRKSWLQRGKRQRSLNSRMVASSYWGRIGWSEQLAQLQVASLFGKRVLVRINSGHGAHPSARWASGAAPFAWRWAVIAMRVQTINPPPPSSLICLSWLRLAGGECVSCCFRPALNWTNFLPEALAGEILEHAVKGISRIGCEGMRNDFLCRGDAEKWRRSIARACSILLELRQQCARFGRAPICHLRPAGTESTATTRAS